MAQDPRLKPIALSLCLRQWLSDASESGILDVINESTPTKIYLPNATAREDTQTELYTRLGLNKRQIELIADAIRKH